MFHVNSYTFTAHKIYVESTTTCAP